jgi:hypothetical protein
MAVAIEFLLAWLLVSAEAVLLDSFFHPERRIPT